jgi:hypothetical protein
MIEKKPQNLSMNSTFDIYYWSNQLCELLKSHNRKVIRAKLAALAIALMSPNQLSPHATVGFLQWRPNGYQHAVSNLQGCVLENMTRIPDPLRRFCAGRPIHLILTKWHYQKLILVKTNPPSRDLCITLRLKRVPSAKLQELMVKTKALSNDCGRWDHHQPRRN